jgi:FG-GAP-like repeat
MPSRVLLRSSVCLFAVLFSVQVLAQSNKPSVARHKTKALKTNARLSKALQVPGLNFAAAQPFYSGGNGANSGAIADVNGDGIPDVVVTNWCSDGNCTGGSVAVLLGKGDGTFQTAVAYASGGLFADFVVVADVNGDGKPDLVVANCGANSQNNCASNSNSGNVAVLLGNGDGTFRGAVTYTLGANGASAVAVADVNGDGIPDLIVGTGSHTAGLVGVLLGNGDGTFQAETTYSSGGVSPLAVAAGDVNGDGHPDVVVANQCADSTCTSSNVGVLLNIGSGTFGAVTTLGSGGIFPDGVVIADVNADGKPDLVVANSSTSSTVDNGSVGVLLGNGDGTFQTAVSYGSGAFGAASVAVADVNGDGKPDLVVANCSATSSSCTGGGGTVGVLLGIGNGTFQTAVTFGAGGNTPFGVAVADVNEDGRPDIVTASCFSGTCGGAIGSVGVLINQSSPWLVYASLGEQVDYFGEGKTDFTVWRPSAGTWFSIDGSGNSLTKQWGLSTDIPVIGDYDGDGKTDVAVWRPSNGTWFIIPSSTGIAFSQQWGAKGDVLVPGDYDGDGKTDIAVWRPSNGTWYILQSSNNAIVQRQWGARGDVPVPGDYDGDGKTDIAVWRPSNGTWYIIQSSTNKAVSYQWGVPTDKPVPSDYDGDGKTDVAVWRPSNGTWYVIQSNNNMVVSQQWGASGDVPVPRDYDGDLKADFAVWRPSNGIWFVILSSNNQDVQQQWGASTDIPVNKPVGQ